MHSGEYIRTSTTALPGHRLCNQSIGAQSCDFDIFHHLDSQAGTDCEVLLPSSQQLTRLDNQVYCLVMSTEAEDKRKSTLDSNASAPGTEPAEPPANDTSAETAETTVSEDVPEKSLHEEAAPTETAAKSISPRSSLKVEAMDEPASSGPRRADVPPPGNINTDVVHDVQGEHSQDATSDHVTSPGLDSLLSPKDPETQFAVRASIAASDVTDDDTRFSTVPLSARQSLDTVQISDDVKSLESEEGRDKRDTLDGSEIVRLVHQNRVHKKTASTSTIVSANNVPFILARLEGDKDPRRISQGEEKLKEAFGQKHGSRSSEEAELVDWGM